MDVVIIGNARCFHTMDWYREVAGIIKPRKVIFLTDLIESESHEKLVKESDIIADLYNIDWLLLKNQSNFGNIWRNIIKLLIIPVQIWKVRRFQEKNPHVIFHAITIYYMFLCWLAGIKFIGTPQGSEILERPDFSKWYKYFAIKSLHAASYITVDSVSMQKKIKEISGEDAAVIQNGIDVAEITDTDSGVTVRNKIISIRGMYPLYRLEEIIKSRNNSNDKPPISFFYPYWDDVYVGYMKSIFSERDLDIGRLAKKDMYTLMKSSYLAISIPLSDSSPRSVYEAIFCGCCVAVTPNLFIDSLPDCMKSRLYIVDLQDLNWFEKAVVKAKVITSIPYIPSEEALNVFDQARSMKLVCDLYYDPQKWN
ncbi:hypothetical protein [Aquirufa ecclesiirivi]|uniref:hypothetical protein n=1 Tax=Aquirufa ecclesiirivi TaxID=2715124 RepID=UPI003BB19654